MSGPGEGHSFESPQRRERTKECSGAIGNVKVRFQICRPHRLNKTKAQKLPGRSGLPKRHAAILAEADYKAILMQIKSNRRRNSLTRMFDFDEFCCLDVTQRVSCRWRKLLCPIELMRVHSPPEDTGLGTMQAILSAASMEIV